MSITDKITGRAKKAAGDLTDDASLRREGRQEERKGEAKDELANAQEKADARPTRSRTSKRKTLSEQGTQGYPEETPPGTDPGGGDRAGRVLRRAKTPKTRRTTTTARPPGTRRPTECTTCRRSEHPPVYASTSSPTARWPATASRWCMTLRV